MKVYLSGAEIPQYQRIMDSVGVFTRSLSFGRIDKRPNVEYFKEGGRYWLDHGLADKSGNEDSLEQYVTDYLDFAKANSEHLDGMLEVDSLPESMRRSVWSDMERMLPDVSWAVWRVEDGQEALRAAVSAYQRLVVVGDGLGKDEGSQALLAAYSGQGGRIHVHQAPNPEHIMRFGPESFSTMTWTAPLRYGELITPRGKGLQRFQHPHTEQTLSVAASRAASLGLDPEPIKRGDMEAGALLAIASLVRYETLLVTNSERADVLKSDEPKNDTAKEDAPESQLLPHRDMPALPILPGMGTSLSTEDEVDSDGRMSSREVTVLNSSEASMRRCDTCVLNMACPSYVPGNACSYRLPVELRTKAQLKALMETMMEIQTQRVAFARFAEEVGGSSTDKSVGEEMDRLMKMIKMKDDLEAQRESITLSMESTKSGGILSALFGARAESANRLPNGGFDAQETDRIIASSVLSVDN